uniref:ribosomal protein L33 n=1 Tax=Asplenium castaneoviride TaxID=2601855 RepID=UPI0023AB00C7|nr:ribosomal protein L33 [Asplenium castaneoviride]YP_010702268.1 ribosomal protein L33 [Asplenium ruprechtii]WCL38479.1 ribosomal protein L33 [Asplenium castaneoviride]WCL38567.1 ribosomal protein L33 [Asplenium castaneoviride]WCL38655.1 ribosomal protein L33 [Asplenium ruprechtii]
MTKRKDARVTIALACTICTSKEAVDKSTGMSRYTTRKNRRNTPTRLESKKFCVCCYKHTYHKELKK